MALPLILDTDIGMDVDDAIALCYAARDPRIDLRAVTTVNGDTQKRAAVARALLRLCGREHVPVGAGASLPLNEKANALMPLDHVDTDEVQGIDSEVHPTAREVLAAALEAASTQEPVTICTIGPVTNIASFLMSRPDLIERVARIQMMGGCLAPWESDGVAGSPYEFNVGCDPLAVAALFALPVPIGLIPIDVTIGAYFSDGDRSTISAAGQLGRVLDVLMKNFLDLLGSLMPGTQPRVRLHDPLTIATLVDSQIARFETLTVTAFGKPGECRTIQSPYGRTIEGCRSVDNSALVSLIIRSLTSQ
jgi:inosine-uridine nucleoside N-ribohydrolase